MWNKSSVVFKIRTKGNNTKLKKDLTKFYYC